MLISSVIVLQHFQCVSAEWNWILDDNTDAFWSACNVIESDSCFDVLQEKKKCQLATELCDG